MSQIAPATAPSATAPPGQSCPTAKIAEIPQGLDTSGVQTTVCLWELSDCTTSPSGYAGTIYAGCTGDVCSCVTPNCQAAGAFPEIVPTGNVTVDDEFLEVNLPIGTTVVFTGVSAATQLLNARPKTLRSNRSAFAYVQPAPFRMIPAAAGDIMTNWGQGVWRVKYLQCLCLNVSGTEKQYFALYKTFAETPDNMNGTTDVASDMYLGMRVSQEPPRPIPGGMNTVPLSSAPNVRLLDPNATGLRRELAVRLAIPQTGPGGAPGSPQKWFQLFGASL